MQRLSKELQGKMGELKEYASKELNVQWNADNTWDVFLSYASEDIDIAEKIFEVLTTRCKKRVWMDKRGGVKPGNLYWEAIQHGIEHSKTCVFVITETYLAKAIDNTHRDENGFVAPTGIFQEIDRIRLNFLSQRKDGKARFYSFPLIQEGTKVSYTDLDNKRHEEIELNGELLEKLHNLGGYKTLRTDALFEGVEALMFNLTNIEDKLINNI